MRVTEANSLKIKNFSEDFSQVTVSDDSAKTFGRTINLKLSTQLLKEFVKDKNLQEEDFLFQKQPFTINKYLRYHAKKIFGNKVSHPKAKGNYKNFTMYDIRHNSACYWFNRYPTAKGLMYRFGWRKADKIEYYSGFLGVSDEIKDSDMILGEDKTKLYKLEEQIEEMKKQMETISKRNAVQVFITRAILKNQQGKITSGELLKQKNKLIRVMAEMGLTKEYGIQN